MSWIILAIIAYFLLAMTNLTDKFLLDKALPSTKTYTFLVNIAGALVILAAPWFLYYPGWQLTLLNLLTGAIFPLGLLLMYQALKTGEPSKILVIIGGSVPIFTVILSFFFLGERFSGNQWLALVGLITGIGLIAWLPAKKTWLKHITNWLGFQDKDQAIGIAEAVFSALIFAIVMTASKSLYTVQAFASAFIWIRLGSALAVLTLLIPTDSRREITKSIHKLKRKQSGLFFGNQLLSGLGFTIQNYAISLASVALVTALQGVQYAFLLIFGAILAIFIPKVAQENISRKIILQKIIAISLIGLSLYFLFI